MASSPKEIDVYLEIGKRRTFAGAIDWPGWCRSGRDEASALKSLSDYGPRYSGALHPAGIEFHPPDDDTSFRVVERLDGDATTDFGAPGAPPASDSRPVKADELRHFQALLEACWRAFDAAVSAAEGMELRKGPRGGGRDLEGIVQHVTGADAGYLGRLGWKFKYDEEADLDEELERSRKAILEGLAAAVQGDNAPRGPRGGIRWTPRYFVRRLAWHVLDHAWEIEDRITS